MFSYKSATLLLIAFVIIPVSIGFLMAIVYSFNELFEGEKKDFNKIPIFLLPIVSLGYLIWRLIIVLFFAIVVYTPMYAFGILYSVPGKVLTLLSNGFLYIPHYKTINARKYNDERKQAKLFYKVIRKLLAELLKEEKITHNEYKCVLSEYCNYLSVIPSPLKDPKIPFAHPMYDDNNFSVFLLFRLITIKIESGSICRWQSPFISADTASIIINKCFDFMTANGMGERYIVAMKQSIPAIQEFSVF